MQVLADQLHEVLDDYVLVQGLRFRICGNWLSLSIVYCLLFIVHCFLCIACYVLVQGFRFRV